MKCQEIAKHFGLMCREIGRDTAYLQSPLVVPGDGSHIGAYVIRTGNDTVRITDDANILFHALTYGVTPSSPRGRALQNIAEQCDVKLSDDGEIYAICRIDQLSYFLPRFFEAADRIAFASFGYRPTPSSAFETMLARALTKAFPQRIKRNFKVFGASGHQLSFPFVLDPEKDRPQFIQVIAAQDNRPNWSSVYQALGKMTDLKNNHVQHSRRLVILEPARKRDTEQAASALAEAASVMVYTTNQDLIARLEAAA